MLPQKHRAAHNVRTVRAQPTTGAANRAGRIWTDDKYQRVMDAADGRRSGLPTSELRLEHLPPDPYPGDNDAITSLIIFAQFYNGYVEIGQDPDSFEWRRIRGLRETSSRASLQSAEIEDFRAALFAWQRMHYHQGGWFTTESEAEDLVWVRLVLVRILFLIGSADVDSFAHVG